jgi:hypothetical protein
MQAREAILEQWIARTAESYPCQASATLTQERDQFRNPVGHTLRQSLSELWQQLSGEMNTSAIDRALDAMIRILAVQGFTPRQAAGCVLSLKSVLQELPSGSGAPFPEGRIDQLALMALDKYRQCREQIAAIRTNEYERATWIERRIGKRRKP